MRCIITVYMFTEENCPKTEEFFSSTLLRLDTLIFFFSSVSRYMHSTYDVAFKP